MSERNAAHRRRAVPERRRTGVIALTAVGAVAILVISIFSALAARGGPASQSATAQARGRLDPLSLKIISYYPSDAGWSDMWAHYSHTKIESDFTAIASLSANTVRVIVQPSAVGYPTLTAKGASSLKDVFAVAAEHGLHVQLTLFDLWANYSDIKGSQTWVRSVFDQIRDTDQLAFTELQNEINPGDPVAVRWAKSMLPFLLTVAPGVPRTLTTPATAGSSAITSLYSQLGKDLLDVVDLHLYGSWRSIEDAIRTGLGVAVGRPVIVGETGLSTGTPPRSSSDSAQAHFYQALAALCRYYRIPPPAPWTLNDFTSTGFQARLPTPQLYYGLRRTDGTWKPAATAVRTAFQGPVVTAGAPTGVFTPDLDGNFDSESSTPSSDGNLGAWQVFGIKYVEGSGTTPSGGRDGGKAAYLKNTTGTDSIVPSIEQSFPLIANCKLTASVWVRLKNASGSTRLAVAWYANDQYISQIESTLAVTTSGDWQKLTVTGPAPSSADEGEIHLKSSDNHGVVYFDDAEISCAAP